MLKIAKLNFDPAKQRKFLKLLVFILLLSLSRNSYSDWQQVCNYSLIPAITSHNNRLFAASLSYILISSDGGNSWFHLADTIGVGSFFVDGSVIYAAGGGIYKSTNDGMNWSKLSSIYVNTLLVSGNNFYAGTEYYGVMISTDHGISWNQSLSTISPVHSLVQYGNAIFAGAGHVYDSINTGVFITTNSGANWSRSSLNDQVVWSLWVSGNSIFAGAGNFPNLPNTGIYVSGNSGATWTQTSLHKMAVSFTSDGSNLFAGTDDQSSFYASNNNGINWIQRSEGLFPGSSVNSLCVFGNYLFAAILGNNASGIYRRPLSDIELTGIELITNEIPFGYSLEQNYPNPFNPSTVISFSVPQSQVSGMLNVQLRIYDVLGREIEKIVDENLTAGSYKIDWNASNYPSGVYFYRLIAGDPSEGSGESFTETKKMTLIK